MARHRDGVTIITVSVSELNEVIEELSLRTDPESIQEFISERIRLVLERTKFALACEQWGKRYKDESRVRSVMQKLVKAGWADELDSIPRAAVMDITRPPTKLPRSSKAWVTMESNLTAIVSKKRAEDQLTARERTMRAVVDQCLTTFSGLFPRYAEFADDEEVKRLLADEKMTIPELHATLVGHAPQIRERWDKEARAKIDALLPWARQDTSVSEHADSELAMKSMVFCSLCHCILQYPEFLVHRCTAASDDLVSQPSACWNKTFMEVVYQVIIACGKDPKTTRVDDMDSSDARLFCACCALQMPGVLTVLSWRDAVAHPYTVPHKSKLTDFTMQGITWRRVSPEDCVAVKPLEDNMAQKNKDQREVGAGWHCVICARWKPLSLSSIGNHVRFQHSPLWRAAGLTNLEAQRIYSYFAPSMEEVSTGGGVFLVSSDLTEGDIAAQFPKVNQALQYGRAAFTQSLKASPGSWNDEFLVNNMLRSG
ncbi:hypothetical protein BXZ70DRAFT_1011591 [Cristinia sonorae]|uniref:Uncharacterized protein n=1 Tax=Cristinia sonorae TaxID=1940300 RepID=A0A8K0XL97_9AGAR|nr:hypothetical protein BXZ70DRAFT_1011591 [Cristinia sonorae]